MTQSDTFLPATMLARQSDVYLLALAKQVYARLVPGMDLSEQSMPHHLLEPFCLALAQMYIDLEDIERRTSLATATGADLDQLGVLFGISRVGATKALGQLVFTGAAGSVIDAGYQVTTSGPTPIAAWTLVPATIPGGGTTVTVSAEAVLPGTAGNLPLGTLVYLTTPSPTGITAVNNPAAFTGGTDSQIDGPTQQYVSGYRSDIRNLSAARGEGGTDKHIRKWARSVPSVGGVRVVDAYPVNGWITVALVGTDMLPASDAVVLQVEDFILDCWRKTIEAETLTISGFGVVLDTQGSDGTPLGGTNNTAKMPHSGSGAGVLTHTGLQTTLVQPGIWRMRIRAKRGAAGTGNCLQFGVWDLTAGAYLNTTFGGATSSLVTLTASQLTTAFVEYQTEFAWFGVNPIEARIIRMTPDTTTDVWIDEVKYWATMSRDDREQGLAPGGMRLNFIPAGQITINVAADVTYGLAAGQTTSTVNADLHDALVEYFASIALDDDNDVRRASIEDVIYGTRGISDVTTVTLNSATNNITVGPTQVAVLGTETWT